MKKMLYFWAAYLLFFALPFPCILYYSIDYPVEAAERTSPAVAIVWLALSILLWALLAATYVHTLLRAPFRAQARTRAIQRAAIRRRARVVQAQDTGRLMRGWRVWNLTLAFDNLSGTPIQDQMLAVDSQPQLQRFVADNQLDALLSDDPGGYPNVVLEGAMPEIDRGRLLRRAHAALAMSAFAASAMFTPYLRTNQAISRVVRRPAWAPATQPPNTVSARLGSRYWGNTFRRSCRG